MEINQQMNEYHVEYNVLQEEMTSSNHHLELLKKEQAQNRHLETQLQVGFIDYFFFKLERSYDFMKISVKKKMLVPSKDRSGLWYFAGILRDA